MPLCYGSVHAQRQLLTPSLLHSLTYAHWRLTTWFCKWDTAGDEYFFFYYQPTWLYYPGSIGLQFPVSACSSEQWRGISFGVLLLHVQCPLCGVETGDVDETWEHLLHHCSGSGHVAESMGLQFLCPACRALGVPLLLYSMSHHVATFIWALLQHVHHQHCACPTLVDSSSDTGPISIIASVAPTLVFLLLCLLMCIIQGVIAAGCMCVCCTC